jgi:energy-coupling factor transporter transmembrane protein EcfT
MNSFISYLEPQNRVATRVVAGICLFFATVVFAGLALIVVVLAASFLIHLGVDVNFVIAAGLAVFLALSYFIITKLPEQKAFGGGDKKYIAPPLFACVHSSSGVSASFITAPPFIPPRRTSFAN